MTARKIVKSDTRKPAKPKQRKGSISTVKECDDAINVLAGQILKDRKTINANFAGAREIIDEIQKRLDALESRDRLRDKSHDKPVSNNAEAIGWRAPRDIPKPPRWQFWRRR